MRRIFYLLMFSLCFGVSSQDYHVYDLIKVNQLPNGNDPGMIRAYEPDTEASRPTGMIFDDFGNLYVADTDKRGLVVTDTNFNFIRNEKYFFAHAGIDAIDNGFFLYYSKDSIAVSIEDGEKYFYVNPFPNRNPVTSSIMYEMNSFFYDEEGNIYCIPDPEFDYATFDAKKVKLYKNEEVVVLLESGFRDNMDGLTIDKDYNLFDPDGVLLTSDFQRYINYWKKQHSINGMNPPQMQFKVSFDLSEISSLDFLGRDSMGNTYWDGITYIYIFNPNGWMIDLLKYEMHKSKTRPAVHPNGDVYFLDYDSDWVYLYKILRQW